MSQSAPVWGVAATAGARVPKVSYGTQRADRHLSFLFRLIALPSACSLRNYEGSYLDWLEKDAQSSQDD